MTSRVGVYTHDASLRHDAGPGHPERPERIETIRTHLDRSGLTPRLVWCQAEPASDDRLVLAHDVEHLAELKRLDASGGGRIDPDTRMSEASLEAARRASGATVDACRRVLDGDLDGAFVLMRPPGHHATPGRAMGFCLVNHVAVGARWAAREAGVERVLIFDWDAHHGNGTQDVFWTDPSVLYVSVHQYPWYPGTGDATETGAGPGEGSTVNVPLPAGAGEDAYERAIAEIVLPEAHAFDPQLVLVSAGYDAHERDPLCMMALRAGAFHRMLERLRDLGKGPVCVLEGGYDLEALAWSAGATLSALLGDPDAAGLPDREREATTGSPDAHRWIDRVTEVRSASRRRGP